ncbi:unnamed protein product [Cochlearia groenlandica]
MDEFFKSVNCLRLRKMFLPSIRKAAAELDYATGKISVWWDINDCPVPYGFDPRRVRSSIEGELKKLGYSGPVSITAYGDQTKTFRNLQGGISSTGVSVAHSLKESTCSFMYSDMLRWRAENPPPATMMLISNQVRDVFSLELIRLQQDTKYNILLAYSDQFSSLSALITSAEWLWSELLPSPVHEEDKEEEEIITESSPGAALFYCKSCNITIKTLRMFRKHISFIGHAFHEVLYPTPQALDLVTTTWARNYKAKPEYATAQIKVWWDMVDCPIPEGYDPRWVRPTIEAELKKLGYFGPVSITAYDDYKQTPDHVLQGLSSTGVDLSQAIFEFKNRFIVANMCRWKLSNPIPDTMMLISNLVGDGFTASLVGLLQDEKCNFVLAYLFRPTEMPVLLTSAEWLWESLLAVPKSKRYVLQKCSERDEYAVKFYCDMCVCEYNSLDKFKDHLSSEDHTLEVKERFRKRKFWEKAFGMGFRHHLHNHVRAGHIARRRARRKALDQPSA